MAATLVGPCSDAVETSRAVRRRHGVGDGAPVNFGRRRLRSVGGQKEFFSKISEKISFYPQHFLMTFSHRKLQQNNYAATMASAARRQIIGGGAPINKRRRRRRPQIVGFAARPAHGSTNQ